MRDRPVEQSIDQMTASACDMSGSELAATGAGSVCGMANHDRDQNGWKSLEVGTTSSPSHALSGPARSP
jgi:hypothetical protein